MSHRIPYFIFCKVISHSTAPLINQQRSRRVSAGFNLVLFSKQQASGGCHIPFSPLPALESLLENFSFPLSKCKEVTHPISLPTHGAETSERQLVPRLRNRKEKSFSSLFRNCSSEATRPVLKLSLCPPRVSSKLSVGATLLTVGDTTSSFHCKSLLLVGKCNSHINLP